jgi:HEAT repeat protein
MTGTTIPGAALASEDPEERRRAARSLVGLEPALAAAGLLTLLGDEDWRVRKEAVAVTQGLAPEPNLLAALVAALAPSENVGLRNATVEALGSFGLDAVDAIAAALRALDADGRKLAAEALARTGQSAALPVLRGLLQDPDPNVCVAAVEAIAGLGIDGALEVVPVLVGCLEAPEEFTRLAALDGLRALGVTLPWERLQRLRDEEVLEHAVLASIGRSGDARAALPLVSALPSARGGTLVETLKSVVDLARSGPASARALKIEAASLDAATQQRLVELASSAEGREGRGIALLALGALGVQDAAGYVLDALGDDELQGAAEEALDWFGSLAVAPLIERAAHASPAERAACLEIAARLSDDASAALVRKEALVALAEPASEVVRSALGALSIVGDEGCLEPVAALLSHADATPALRRATETSLAVLGARFADAARELARLAPPASLAAHAAAVLIRVVGPPVRGSLEADVEFLAAALSSAAPAVRRAALPALAAVGGALAVEPIALALTDEEREVRLAAARALGRLRSPEGEALGVPQLVALAERASDDEMHIAALLGLGETSDPRALPILRPLVRSGDPKAAVAAVEALGAFPEARRTEALIDGLSHPASEVVKAAVRALGESSDARVLAHLSVSLDHEAWDVRRLAADVLARYGEAAVAPLRARLAVEEDPLVREAIGRALESMVGAHRSPLPTRGSYLPR